MRKFISENKGCIIEFEKTFTSYNFDKFGEKADIAMHSRNIHPEMFLKDIINIGQQQQEQQT